MCADLAIHKGQRENDSHIKNDLSQSNPHIHILLTDRPIEFKGFCTKKNRDWNNKNLVRQWRELWEKVQNKALEKNDLKIRVSHESLDIQGIDREPKKHIGRKATEMKRRGIETNRDNENRSIETRNKDRVNRKYQRQLEREEYRNFELSR